MPSSERVLACADVLEVMLAVPPGHQHLRARLVLSDGSALVLQEATLAGLVRAYIAIKTHPTKATVLLKGCELDPQEHKPGFASWQLLEEE